MLGHIFPMPFPTWCPSPATRDCVALDEESWGLVLCCHVSPVPSGRYSTVLCTHSVTQADKERPSGSLCPTHCTTGNYHHHHPISGVFKWGHLICRWGAVSATYENSVLIQLSSWWWQREMQNNTHARNSFGHQQIRMQRTSCSAFY